MEEVRPSTVEERNAQVGQPPQGPDSQGSRRTRQLQLIRLVGSSLCLLASGTFCHLFSHTQFAAFVRHAGFGAEDFPVLCVAFSRYSPLIMLAAPLLFAIGLNRLSRDRSPSLAAESVVQLALVLAFLLMLACIVAWQIPYRAFSASGRIASVCIASGSWPS